MQELARVLFDALESSLAGTENSDLMQNLFKGTLHDYVRCKTCGTERSRSDIILDLSLVIKSFDSTKTIHSVEEALEDFVRPEVMEGDNSVECSHCGKKTSSTKGLKISEPPYLLQLQLKRFVFDWETMSRRKVNDKVTFPLILDMNKFVSDGQQASGASTSAAETHVGSCSASAAAGSGATESSAPPPPSQPAAFVASSNNSGADADVAMAAGVDNSDCGTGGTGDTTASAGGAASSSSGVPASTSAEAEQEAALLAAAVSEAYGSYDDLPALEMPDGTSAASLPREGDTGSSAPHVPIAAQPAGADSATNTPSTDVSSSPPAFSPPPPPKSVREQALELMERNGPHVYELYAVLVHSGSALGGHYYAYIKDLESGKWNNFNDSTVSPIEESAVLDACGGESKSMYGGYSYANSANAYMLMYRKVLVPDFVEIQSVKAKRERASSTVGANAGDAAVLGASGDGAHRDASASAAGAGGDSASSSLIALPSPVTDASTSTVAQSPSAPLRSGRNRAGSQRFIVMPRSYPTDDDIPSDVRAIATSDSNTARADEDRERKVRDGIDIRVRWRGTMMKVPMSRSDTVADMTQAVYDALKLDQLEWDGSGGMQDAPPGKARHRRSGAAAASASTAACAGATRKGVPRDCIRIREADYVASDSSVTVLQPLTYNPKPVVKSAAASFNASTRGNNISSGSNARSFSHINNTDGFDHDYSSFYSSASPVSSSASAAGDNEDKFASDAAADGADSGNAGGSTEPAMEDGSQRKIEDLGSKWRVYQDVAVEFRSDAAIPWPAWDASYLGLRVIRYDAESEEFDDPIRIWLPRAATLAHLGDAIESATGIPREKQRLLRIKTSLSSATKAYEYQTHVALNRKPLHLPPIDADAPAGAASGSLSRFESNLGFSPAAQPVDASGRVIGDTLQLGLHLRINTGLDSTDVYVEERDAAPAFAEDFQPDFDNAAVSSAAGEAGNSAAAAQMPDQHNDNSDEPTAMDVASRIGAAAITDDTDSKMTDGPPHDNASRAAGGGALVESKDGGPPDDPGQVTAAPPLGAGAQAVWSGFAFSGSNPSANQAAASSSSSTMDVDGPSVLNHKSGVVNTVVGSASSGSISGVGYGTTYTSFSNPFNITKGSSFPVMGDDHGLKEVKADECASLRLKQKLDSTGVWKYAKPEDNSAKHEATLDCRMTVDEVYAHFAGILDLPVGSFVLRRTTDDGIPLKLQSDKQRAAAAGGSGGSYQPQTLREAGVGKDGVLYCRLAPTPTTDQYLIQVHVFASQPGVVTGTDWLPPLPPPPSLPPPSSLSSFAALTPSMSGSVPSQSCESLPSASPTSSVEAVVDVSAQQSPMAADVAASSTSALPPPSSVELQRQQTVPRGLQPAANPTYGGWYPAVYTVEEGAERIRILEAERAGKEAKSTEAAKDEAVVAAAVAGGGSGGTGADDDAVRSAEASTAVAATQPMDAPSEPPTQYDPSSLAIVVAGPVIDHAVDSGDADDPMPACVPAAPRANANKKRGGASDAVSQLKKTKSNPASSPTAGSSAADVDASYSAMSQLFGGDDDEFESTKGADDEEADAKDPTKPPAPGGHKFLCQVLIKDTSTSDDIRAAAVPYLITMKMLPEGTPSDTKRVRVREMTIANRKGRVMCTGCAATDIMFSLDDKKKIAIEVLDDEETIPALPAPQSTSSYKPMRPNFSIAYVQWFDRARWRLGKKREIRLQSDKDTPKTLLMQLSHLQGLLLARHESIANIEQVKQMAIATTAEPISAFVENEATAIADALKAGSIAAAPVPSDGASSSSAGDDDDDPMPKLQQASPEDLAAAALLRGGGRAAPVPLPPPPQQLTNVDSASGSPTGNDVTALGAAPHPSGPPSLPQQQPLTVTTTVPAAASAPAVAAQVASSSPAASSVKSTAASASFIDAFASFDANIQFFPVKATDPMTSYNYSSNFYSANSYVSSGTMPPLDKLPDDKGWRYMSVDQANKLHAYTGYSIHAAHGGPRSFASHRPLKESLPTLSELDGATFILQDLSIPLMQRTEEEAKAMAEVQEKGKSSGGGSSGTGHWTWSGGSGFRAGGGTTWSGSNSSSNWASGRKEKGLKIAVRGRDNGESSKAAGKPAEAKEGDEKKRKIGGGSDDEAGSEESIVIGGSRPAATGPAGLVMHMPSGGAAAGARHSFSGTNPLHARSLQQQHSNPAGGRGTDGTGSAGASAVDNGTGLAGGVPQTEQDGIRDALALDQTDEKRGSPSDGNSSGMALFDNMD